LVAGAGNDNLTGLAGNDRLVGRGGSDKIVGGNGNDKLIGGIGNTTNINTKILNTNGIDLLIGRQGQDIFALEMGIGYADIRDFHHAQRDKLGMVRGLSVNRLSVYDKGRDLWVVSHNDLLAILRNVQQLTVSDLVKL
jgi:Ca2+-binding RTX toxin-like protein